MLDVAGEILKSHLYVFDPIDLVFLLLEGVLHLCSSGGQVFALLLKVNVEVFGVGKFA